MSCNAPEGDVYECGWCKCQFEEGVAGMSRDGRARCPQCGLSDTTLVAPEDVGKFVVSRRTSFR